MTPYEVLDVSPECTLEQAEEAYHRQILRHHPDLHQAGGPHAIAAAEARTRALNTAIEWVRTVKGVPSAGAAAGTGSVNGSGTTEHRPAGSRADEPGSRDERTDDGATADHEHGRRPDDGFARPVAVCPYCGLVFGDSATMKQHVADLHGLRLEREPRRHRRFTARIGRRVRGLRHVPLLYVLPFNALAALLLAFGASQLDPLLGYWVFAVAMAPTFVIVLAHTLDR